MFLYVTIFWKYFSLLLFIYLSIFLSISLSLISFSSLNTFPICFISNCSLFPFFLSSWTFFLICLSLSSFNILQYLFLYCFFTFFKIFSLILFNFFISFYCSSAFIQNSFKFRKFIVKNILQSIIDVRSVMCFFKRNKE